MSIFKDARCSSSDEVTTGKEEIDNPIDRRSNDEGYRNEPDKRKKPDKRVIAGCVAVAAIAVIGLSFAFMPHGTGDGGPKSTDHIASVDKDSDKKKQTSFDSKQYTVKIDVHADKLTDKSTPLIVKLDYKGTYVTHAFTYGHWQLDKQFCYKKGTFYTPVNTDGSYYSTDVRMTLVKDLKLKLDHTLASKVTQDDAEKMLLATVRSLRYADETLAGDKGKAVLNQIVDNLSKINGIDRAKLEKVIEYVPSSDMTNPDLNMGLQNVEPDSGGKQAASDQSGNKGGSGDTGKQSGGSSGGSSHDSGNAGGGGSTPTPAPKKKVPIYKHHDRIPAVTHQEKNYVTKQVGYWIFKADGYKCYTSKECDDHAKYLHSKGINTAYSTGIEEKQVWDGTYHTVVDSPEVPAWDEIVGYRWE